MANPHPKRLFTQEEYLLLERQAVSKSEFFQGEIFALAGASRYHNQIKENLSIYLGGFLKGKSCHGYSSDMRVHIPSNTLYNYPDYLVVCGEDVFMDENLPDTLLNPIIIFEISSATTAGYDKAEKFRLYQGIPSLTQYIIINGVDRVEVESFDMTASKTQESTRLTSRDESMHLDSLHRDLALGLIYDEVAF